jgi:hypothetical protein
MNGRIEILTPRLMHASGLCIAAMHVSILLSKSNCGLPNNRGPRILYVCRKNKLCT